MMMASGCVVVSVGVGKDSETSVCPSDKYVQENDL